MRLLLFIFLLSLVSSCSKEAKSNKRLSGTWSPVTLKVTDNLNGLSNLAEVSGSLNFYDDRKKSTKGNYAFSINYIYKGNDYQIVESGTYEIIADECFLSSTNNVDTPSRIIYLNKEDFEFSIEKSNSNRLLFLLKKN